MTNAWSLFVIFLVVLYIVGSGWLLFAQRTKKLDEGEAAQTLNHEFDGIQELDSPLPRWWFLMFVGTILYSVGYLVMYPGFGNFPGLLGWTSTGQFEDETAEHRREYGALYAGFAQQPIEKLTSDPVATRIGARVFSNNCAQCHGSDARGGIGFPNLTDDDWLYGGAPEMIETTILSGRRGMMPPFGPAVGEESVPNVVAYVLSLSGKQVDPAKAALGKEKFQQICIACHGPEGKGNPLIGSPNLTDNIWLHGGTADAITEGLWKGRSSNMPPHGEILGPEKVRLVASYVYGLSNDGK